MFDFGIFCYLRRLMGINRVPPPSGYLKSFVLSFVFVLFFSFSFLFHFLCVCVWGGGGGWVGVCLCVCLHLSGAPLAPGPLDIVHPCHPVATPLILPLFSFPLFSRYASRNFPVRSVRGYSARLLRHC